MITIQVGQLQHFGTVLTGCIQVQFQDDAVLGEGAGLIGAKNIHGPKILDGIDIFDNYFLPRHGNRSAGKIGGNNHRQHFGRQPHGHR